MTHTPGPWEVSYDGDVIAGNRYVANIIGADGSFDDARDNARLIAAAPDLLAALEYIAKSDQHGGWGVFREEMIETARAAIAKANGKD